MAEKTLEEIKADILHRAGRINPFERVKREDVEQVVRNLTSLDADLWGREWGKVGLKYEAVGEEQEKQGQKKNAGQTYYLAYEYYRIGRYGAKQPGKNELLQRRAQDFFKGGADDGPIPGADRNPFRGEESRRLFAGAERYKSTPGCDALGRRRWLERRSAHQQ